MAEADEGFGVSLRNFSTFSGIGMDSLAASWAGFETVAFCEIDTFCQSILKWHWPKTPIHEDITKISDADLRGYRGLVDIVSGGFPCQDISSAGKGAGLEGKRSGLFFELVRVIREIRPTFCLIENVSSIRTRGIDRCLDELDRIGYASEPYLVGAGNAGAPHPRRRVLIMGVDAGRMGQWPRQEVKCRDPFDSERNSSQEKPERHDFQPWTSESIANWRLDSDPDSIKWNEAQDCNTDGTERGARTLRTSSGPSMSWRICEPPFPGMVVRNADGLDESRIEALGNSNPPQIYYPFYKWMADQLNGVK